MTQQDLLDWVKAHGAKETHQKKTFYRVVGANGKATGIPQPREGHTDLLPMTVCHVCTTLEIPLPDCAQEAYKTYNAIQQKHNGKGQ